MKYFKIRNLFRAVLLLCLFFTMSFSLCASNEGSASGVDVKEIVLGHMSDAYEWHITTWNGHHISIPLPVIVKGESGGWHVFSSERFHDSTNGTFEGFYLDETHNGKIYEHLANGQNVRPIDLSITKNVVQIWIVVLLMAVIFISSARWYRGRQAGDKAPGGFVGLVEMFVMSINDDLIRPSVGEKHYKQYAPFLLTAFFFIFIIGTGHFNQVGTGGHRISIQYSLLPNTLTNNKVNIANTNVMFIFPVMFAPPGKIGRSPNRFVMKMKKNAVSKKGAYCL